MTDPRADSKDAAAAMLRALNEHGHAFAASVLQSVHNRGSEGTWYLEAAEFAGELGPRVFHIDGVLQCRPRYQPELILAAVECKRADPALSRWCFIRNSAVRGHSLRRRPIVDRYSIPEPHVIAPKIIGAQACVSVATNELMYQLGVELKTNKTGSQVGRSLNDALTQASLGAAGLVGRLAEWGQAGGFAYVIPVIATTAELLVTNSDLAQANIETGDLRTGSLQTQTVPWLWFEAHLSLHLAPLVDRRWPSPGVRQVGETLDHQQARAVMIARGTELLSALDEIAFALSTVDTLRG
jgi:hypothetical protein